MGWRRVVDIETQHTPKAQLRAVPKVALGKMGNLASNAIEEASEEGTNTLFQDVSTKFTEADASGFSPAFLPEESFNLFFFFCKKIQ